MTSTIKNIIIFAVVGIILVLIYIFLIKKSPAETPLISTSGSNGVASPGSSAYPESAVAQEFLSLLLSVRNIRLDDGIFSDPAFVTLRDSSIVLVADGTEGRINPFAPIGSEGSPSSPLIQSGTPSVSQTTPANPQTSPPGSVITP